MILLAKKSFPFIILVVFLYFIFNFYQNNKQDFDFIYNFNFNFIFGIFLLCFLYLLTEAIIFKNIVKFFFKKESSYSSFLVICTTYLCNTFVQFSGLGYRAYYLNKFKQIKIKNFIVLSFAIIFIELLIFSGISFSLLLVFDIINENITIYLYTYILLILIIILAIIAIFIYPRINKILLSFNLINKIKILHIVVNNLEEFDFKRLYRFFFKFALLFFLQFILLFSIFYSTYINIGEANFILFSLLATMSTDLSFIFAFTPYGIGINEFFMFFSSNNFNIKFSEILFLTNLFRVCMFGIYFLIGIINLFIFSKKITKARL